MIFTLLAIAALNIVIGNVLVLAHDDDAATSEKTDGHPGFMSKLGGVVGFGTVGGVAVKLGAGGSVPTIMSLTGNVVAGTGTFHGVLVGVVQGVAAAPVVTAVATGAVVGLAGYGACKMTSYGTACDEFVDTVGNGITTGKSIVGTGMQAIIDKASALME